MSARLTAASIYPQQLDGSFEAFGNTALTRINAVTANASYAYANRTNGMISSAQDDLNEHLFGWVNTTTGTMNNTLNELVDGLSSALNVRMPRAPFDVRVSWADVLSVTHLVGDIRQYPSFHSPPDLHHMPSSTKGHQHRKGAYVAAGQRARRFSARVADGAHAQRKSVARARTADSGGG